MGWNGDVSRSCQKRSRPLLVTPPETRALVELSVFPEQPGPGGFRWLAGQAGRWHKRPLRMEGAGGIADTHLCPRVSCVTTWAQSARGCG